MAEYPHLTRLLWFSTLLDAAIHRQWILKMQELPAPRRVAHGAEDADDEQWRGLTDGAGEAEDGAGRDAGHGRRQDLPPRRLPLGGAEGERAEADLVGHRPHRLAGGDDDDRQDQQGERDGAAEDDPLALEAERGHAEALLLVGQRAGVDALLPGDQVRNMRITEQRDAIGAGFQLALACDLRLFGEDTVFCLPPAKIGVIYAPEGLRRLSLLVGPARAKQMIFSGERVGAEQAERWGLVNEVVPRAELSGGARSLAEAFDSRLRRLGDRILVVDYVELAPAWQRHRPHR